MPPRQRQKTVDEELADALDPPNPLQHGHEMTSAEEETDDEEQTPAPKQVSIADIQQQMLAMERRHSEEVAALRRTQPPATPKPPEVPSEEEDWDNLLFTKPKEAVSKIVQKAEKEISARLERRYQQDKNTQKFWEAFDKTYPDLIGDRDLVEMTMNANLAQVANIPVEQAMEKIADLTRTRIQRYTQTRPKGKKAFAEGGGPPLPKAPRPDEPKVVGLSEIIRRRNAKRRGQTA